MALKVELPWQEVRCSRKQGGKKPPKAEGDLKCPTEQSEETRAAITLGPSTSLSQTKCVGSDTAMAWST